MHLISIQQLVLSCRSGIPVHPAYGIPVGHDETTVRV